MKEAHDIQLLVIDYLQLLSGSSTFSGSDNRQGEISEISRMMKNLANRLNINVTARPPNTIRLGMRPWRKSYSTIINNINI